MVSMESEAYSPYNISEGAAPSCRLSLPISHDTGDSVASMLTIAFIKLYAEVVAAVESGGHAGAARTGERVKNYLPGFRIGADKRSQNIHCLLGRMEMVAAIGPLLHIADRDGRSGKALGQKPCGFMTAFGVPDAGRVDFLPKYLPNGTKACLRPRDAEPVDCSPAAE